MKSFIRWLEEESAAEIERKIAKHQDQIDAGHRLLSVSSGSGSRMKVADAIKFHKDKIEKLKAKLAKMR